MYLQMTAQQIDETLKNFMDLESALKDLSFGRKHSSLGPILQKMCT